jgi:hypothetical protein
MNEVTIKVELIDETKATLRQAIHAACLHEEGMQQLEKAGESVAAVLYRTAVEVYEHAGKVSKEAKIAMPDGESLSVYFTEALVDAENSLREESSRWKHMQKLPRAWINAKSALNAYFGFDQVDFSKQKSINGVQEFNKAERKRLKNEKANASQDAAQAAGLSLVPPAQDDAPAPDGKANIEKSETTQTNVSVQQVETAELDSTVADLIQEIAQLCADVEPTKAVKMLNGFKGQLSGVAKAALTKLASNG